MSEKEIERLRKELVQVRREKEEAQAREKEERRKNQNTNLEEYLYNCHFHLYQKLSLAHPSKCSMGNTSVEGKYYPKWLRPWHEFEKTHQPRHFEVIKSACKDRRLFHREFTTIDIGSTVSEKPAGNEEDIDSFETHAVESPVWQILRHLWDDEDLRTEYQCSQVRFSNNRLDVMPAINQGPPAMATDFVGESQERRRGTGSSKRTATEQKVKPPSTRPDGYGIRVHLGGDESHCFALDYKCAHKVPAKSVKPAVAKETLFMEVMRRICSGKVSIDASRKHEETEEVIAMALTQVFDYMVRYEVAYGYVAAGKCLLLLHIDRADLQTLYCHASVPEEDVGPAADGVFTDDTMRYTAVAQLASFFLLSLQSEALRGLFLAGASQTAEATLKKWKEPYEDAASILEVENTDSSPSSSQETRSSQESGSIYCPSVSSIDRKKSLQSCKPTDLPTERDDEDEADGPDEGPTQRQPRVETKKRKDGPSSSSSEGESTEMTWLPTRQYCTQACLLGLKRNLNLDDNCPNVRLHQTAEGCRRHPIDAEAFTRLMSQQLRQNPYQKCDALDRWRKWGAIGMLFKLELEPYGYTLVAKGALSGHPHDLEHESTVYARLEKLQGHVVPVHLGLVELDEGHLIAGGIQVFDMMLMSWGGENALEDELPDLAREVRLSSQAVLAEGVRHGDQRAANQLWNAERQQVMLIDFDQATLLPKPRNKLLLEIAGKKRKQRGGDYRHSRRRRLLYSQTQAV